MGVGSNEISLKGQRNLEEETGVIFAQFLDGANDEAQDPGDDLPQVPPQWRVDFQSTLCPPHQTSVLIHTAYDFFLPGFGALGEEMAEPTPRSQREDGMQVWWLSTDAPRWATGFYSGSPCRQSPLPNCLQPLHAAQPPQPNSAPQTGLVGGYATALGGLQGQKATVSQSGCAGLL